jgi:hypothetical protein
MTGRSFWRRPQSTQDCRANDDDEPSILSHAYSLVCWTYLFDPEDGGDKFLRNVGRNSTDYLASYPR